MTEASDAPEKTADQSTEPSYTQGFHWEGDDDKVLEAALDAAFGYRGNVTLFTREGEEITCYLFNRDADGAEPSVEIFPVEGGRRRVLYAQIRGISFSGKDTAAGKSWETWLKKYNAKKAAEARGEKVGSIDLGPAELD